MCSNRTFLALSAELKPEIAMRKYFVVITTSLLFFTACGWNRSGEPVDAGPEAFFRANQQRTGVYQSAVVKNPETAWTFQTGEWVDTAPAVVKNTLYFGSYDGNVYAVDAKTGAEIWRFATNNPVLSSPAVSGEIVYVGGLDSALYALNRNSGENIWRFPTRGGVLASPAVANGLAYVGSDGGIMYAVNINNGQEAWHIEANGPVLFPAAIADGLMIFSDLSGKLTAVQAINGEQVWQMQIGEGYTTSGPAIKDGILYILFTDSNQAAALYAIDLAAQSVRWQYPLSAESYSAPTIGDELVFVADLSGLVTAVEQNSGSLRWQFSAGDLIFSAPAMTGDVLYFGSMDQNLYAVDSQTGQEIWRLPLGSGVSSPAIYDGVLYVGTENGKMSAISNSE